MSRGAPTRYSKIAGQIVRRFSLLSAALAIAGCATPQPVAAVDVDGNAVVDNLPVHFHERIDLRSGNYLREWSSGPGGIGEGEGFDGRRWWTRDLSGASHDLDAPSAKRLATSIAWLNRQGWRTRYADGTIDVTPPGGARITLSVSQGRIIRTVFVLPENREIQTFSDWHTVEGVQIPFVRRVDDPEDDSHETWTASHVAIARTSFEQRAFASPPPPRDAGTTIGGPVTVPLHIIYDKPRISVGLNGRGPFTYVPDSGGHFIATPATARAAGLAGIGSANHTGAGTAIVPVRFARTQRVDIGSAFMRSQVAKIVPYTRARLERSVLPDATGWLGLETFERFAITMDPRRQLLGLAPFASARTPAGVRVPIVFDEDAPLVSCTVNGKAGYCMIDTGNASNTIVEGHWAEQNGLSGQLKRGLDVGDNTWVSRADIRIGSLDLPNEVIEYSPPAVRGSESTTTVAAILSEDILRRFVLTLNYDRHAAWFSPVSGATARAFNGTGIEATKQPTGYFLISYVIAGSPAARRGLKPGDSILMMNGVDLRAVSSPEFREWNAVRAGSTVTLRIRKTNNSAQALSLTTRDLLAHLHREVRHR